MLWQFFCRIFLSYFLVFPSSLPPHLLGTPTLQRNNNDTQVFTTFQAHSFNDLNQWESLYLKGVRNFKIDPYFFLELHKKILLPDRNHSYIVLTHDLPTLKHNKYFNLQSVLEEISPTGKTGKLLIRDHGAKLTIQLCFKAVPQLCTNKHFRSRYERDFLFMVDEFYTQAELLRTQVLGEHKLEFILDGGGKPYGCIANKWPQWKSVWISNDAPQSPANVLTLPPNVSTRFEILNNPADVKAWSGLAKMNFGRFAHFPHPYQVWEPNDQQMIQDHIAIFAQQQQPVHNAGMCFSSNSDPVMIALYSGAHDRMARNSVIQRNVTTRTVPIGITTSASHVVVLHTENGTLMQTIHAKEGSLSSAGPEMVSSYAWERFAESTENKYWGVLSDQSGRFAMTIMRPLNGRLIVLDQGKRAPLPPHLKSTSAAIACLVVRSLRHGQLAALWSVAAISESTCSLYAVLFNAVNNKVEKSTCLLEGNKKSPVITGADFIRLRRNVFGVVFADQKKQVFSTLWNSHAIIVDGEDEDFITGDDEEDLHFQNLKQITVGVLPRFSEIPAKLGKNRLVGLVLGDSYCTNNEPANKRAGVLLCNAPPVASRGILTYTLGVAAEWETMFRARAKRGDAILSACSSKLFHGAFDIGAYAVPQLVMMNERRGEAQFVSVHRTVDDMRSNEQTCGVSRWKNALVMNQFDFFFQDHTMKAGENNNNQLGLFTRRGLRLLRNSE